MEPFISCKKQDQKALISGLGPTLPEVSKGMAQQTKPELEGTNTQLKNIATLASETGWKGCAIVPWKIAIRAGSRLLLGLCLIPSQTIGPSGPVLSSLIVHGFQA